MTLTRALGFAAGIPPAEVIPQLYEPHSQFEPHFHSEPHTGNALSEPVPTSQPVPTSAFPFNLTFLPS